ncbi:MAG: hypothetical protein HYV28_07460 [Ignavibacteriales bacterium]|nr:hypothetical protein [Ignavibacteriales bacterium]
MKFIKKALNLFSKKHPTQTTEQVVNAPLLVIKRVSNDWGTTEFHSIEEAIVELENDPNVPFDKIEKLKISLEKLKNRSSITIRNGDIV